LTIDALRLPDAFQLYQEIAPFVEKADIHEESLTFLHRVIGRMRERDPYAYIRSVCLMSGKTQDEIIQMKSDTILQLFIDGLTANQIISLLEFGERVGFSHAG